MSARFYEFGPFRVDTVNHVLLRDGQTIPLKPKVFDTLLVLVENRARVLDKDELMSRLWPDTVVEESNLTQNVYLLRKVLGEDSQPDAYIETMPKRGYRFVASVNEVEPASTDLIVEEHSRSRLVIEHEDEADLALKFATEAEQAIQEKALTAGRWEKQASWWKLGALVLAVCILGLGLAFALPNLWTKIKSKPIEPHPQIRSIAVLPFKALGTDPSDDYLGLGMADTLITRLSRMNQLVVRPTSAVRKFASPNQDPVAAGRELKVDAALESSIQRVGDKIRVTLRLVSATDGSTLWADQVDEQVNDIFAVQDRVSEKVARALVPQLTGRDKDLLVKHYTQNPDAYRLYMNGRYLWNKATVEDWNKALEYFNLAIEKDPNYALAYTGLADAYFSVVADSLVPKAEAIPKAKQAAMMALRLDDTLAEAHVSLGRIKAYYDWDWSDAEAEFRRAIELDPNCAIAHREYGGYLATIGRSDQAIAEAKQGRDLDPVSQLANFYVAWTLISGHRYDEAIEQSQQVLGTFPIARYWMGLAYLGKGQYEEAIAEFEKSLSTSRENDVVTKPHLGYAYAISGKRDQAQTILAELKELFKQHRVSPYFIAMVYAGLREKDQVFAWLEKAYHEHSRPLWGLKVNPVWDNLRSDPRFADLLQRIGVDQR
jgi:TolB-like protein/DNA-binding winged helix-turn-helix (wHTH) protein/Tfp pilus assembly protein PilF